MIETLIVAAPDASVSFYGTASGTEVDLILDLGGRQGRWALDIKRSASPSVSKGLHNSIADLKPSRTSIVYAYEDSFPLSGEVEAIGLSALGERLTAR